ncbi:hypothetical protein ABPG72_015130 [Tetrahymena utriculariae]
MAAIREIGTEDLTNIDLDDSDFEQFLININQSDIDVSQKLSKETVNDNLQQIFIYSCEQFLSNYKPLYDTIQQISDYSTDLNHSLNKIDDLSTILKYQNRSHLFKIEKLQLREDELQEKKKILDKLFDDSHIDSDLIRHLLHSEVIDEKFFKAFQSIEALKQLYDELGKVDTPEQGLRNSLMKNFNEIRSVGLSRMIKALHTSIQKSQPQSLKLFRQSLEENEEGYLKFLEVLYKHRKQIIKEKLTPLKNKINYSMTTKMNIFLNELFLSFFEIIRNEKAFMRDVFDENQAIMKALDVADELFVEILLRVERSLIVEKDFYEMFKIRECLERNKINFMNSMNITEEDLKDSELLHQELRERTISLGQVPQLQQQSSSNSNQNSQQKISDEKISFSNDRKMLSILLVQKLINQTNSLIRHNLSNEADILLNTKFDIQRIAAYQCIVDLVEKVNNVYKIIFQEPQRYQDLSTLQFLHPLENLIEQKMSKKSIPTCIFSSNVYMYLVQELSQYAVNSRELEIRLNEYETQVEEYLTFISLCNLHELLKLGKIENFESNIQERVNKKDQDESFKLLIVNAKRAFVFLLNLQTPVSKKILFRDRYLIQDEQQRYKLKQKIIEELVKRYAIFYNELNEYTKKNFNGSELFDIPQNAKQLAEKFNLDINDYIDLSTTNAEQAIIYTPEQIKQKLNLEEE